MGIQQSVLRNRTMHQELAISLIFVLNVILVWGGNENIGKEDNEEKLVLDDAINEKIERYLKLLEKKRDAIDKFLVENYSDFNHSDFTPEEYVSHPINAYVDEENKCDVADGQAGHS